MSSLDFAQITRLRRDIHAHPELGFEEQRTSDLVADQLQSWGIEVHRGMARTAVIGLVHGRDNAAGWPNTGRAVGLRADMDALPVQEENSFAHASQHAGVMHACGHDGHTAMLLAAAQQLAARRDFDGTVVLIFQPAEEGRGGAQAMVAEGLFERYPMEAVFGLHNWPGYPVGSIAATPGPVMASASLFDITVQGQGSHAAMPHLGIDPVPVACAMVTAFQSIVSRNLPPLDTAVLSVTMVHAGKATNVVPDSCRIQGTVRTFTVAALDLIEQRMRSIAEQISAAHGAGCRFEFARRAPPVVNHAREAAFAAQVIQDLVGPQMAMVQEPSMASEDFAYMLLAKPGCYAFIGNGEGDHRQLGHGGGPCMLHNPSYDFNDALIPLGARYWVALATRWLAAPASPMASTDPRPGP